MSQQNDTPALPCDANHAAERNAVRVGRKWMYRGEVVPQPKFLTRYELAERWHCHAETIKRKQDAGLLAAVRIGRRWLYRMSEIQQMEANT